MTNRKTLKFSLISLVTLATIVALGFLAQPPAATEANNVLNLQAPPFLGTVYADSAPTAQQAAALAARPLGALLPTEIGISGYFTAGTTIDLAEVRALFKTDETPPTVTDYVIGSVIPTGYGSEHAVHVYAHASGWVLAYYLDTEPTAFIFDFIHYTGASTTVPTKIDIVLSQIAAQVSALQSDIIYYHFSHPNATRMMLIAEEGENHNFTVNLPDSYTFFEKSWGGSGCIYIDGANQGCGHNRGKFGPEFDTGQDHLIAIGWCGSCYLREAIALIYREH